MKEKLPPFLLSVFIFFPFIRLFLILTKNKGRKQNLNIVSVTFILWVKHFLYCLYSLVEKLRMQRRMHFSTKPSYKVIRNYLPPTYATKLNIFLPKGDKLALLAMRRIFFSNILKIMKVINSCVWNGFSYYYTHKKKLCMSESFNTRIQHQFLLQIYLCDFTTHTHKFKKLFCSQSWFKS